MELNINKKIGNLEFAECTYLVEKHPINFEIRQWNKDGKYAWTILTFEFDEAYNSYYIKECGDRLDDENINWNNLGELIKFGRKFCNIYKELKDCRKN